MSDNFLEDLAIRKLHYFLLLYVRHPNVSTSDDCFKRIIRKAAYEEILTIIEYLQPKDKIKVESIFDEKLETYK